eukprot:6137407-Pleurochrysis_carterae.AAC.1
MADGITMRAICAVCALPVGSRAPQREAREERLNRHFPLLARSVEQQETHRALAFAATLHFTAAAAATRFTNGRARGVRTHRRGAALHDHLGLGHGLVPKLALRGRKC